MCDTVSLSYGMKHRKCRPSELDTRHCHMCIVCRVYSIRVCDTLLDTPASPVLVTYCPPIPHRHAAQC